LAKLYERLGYPKQARVLIINCDDLGSSHAANTAIERALREGIASSTTLMVPCPWSRTGAKACRDLDVGVHLTLTAEYPGYRWRSLTGAASLHDKDGYLPQTVQEVLTNAHLDDVERECRAQIEQALSWGVDVSHIDSHMDVMQADRHFFTLYMRMAQEFRLPVRLRRSHFEAFSYISRSSLERAGIVSPDNFVGSQRGTPARAAFAHHIPKLPQGITEIFVHPAEDGPELRGYDKDSADLRASDANCLVDPEMRALIENNNVTLIGYKPLREAMRTLAPV
jgi:predicted glycoside hydrolase/deacetylase ChbG (UPF0249 family)